MAILFVYTLSVLVFNSDVVFKMSSTTFNSTTLSSTKINDAIISINSELEKELFKDYKTYKSDYIPRYSDNEIKIFISKLNEQTVVDLYYDKAVKSYIDVYALKRRAHTSTIMARAEYYFPMFEKMLHKYNLPEELKYVAIIESALKTTARSKSEAMGLWQLMYHSAKMFDLKINSYVDERFDPIKSTEAACKYLKYLYRVLGDWQLAIAAYNGGPGVVRNAIIRSGGKTKFREIQKYLPSQTRKYVPTFIAAMYVFNNYKEHNLRKSFKHIPFYNTDTVMVKKPVYFSQIAKTLDINIRKLSSLNPQFTKKYIPKSYTPCCLVLPINKIEGFIKNENIIYKTRPKIKNYKHKKSKLKRITHIVKKGEFCHKIAMKYMCSVNEIKKWNKLPNFNLAIGQRLYIWIDDK